MKIGSGPTSSRWPQVRDVLERRKRRGGRVRRQQVHRPRSRTQDDHLRLELAVVRGNERMVRVVGDTPNASALADLASGRRPQRIQAPVRREHTGLGFVDRATVAGQRRKFAFHVGRAQPARAVRPRGSARRTGRRVPRRTKAGRSHRATAPLALRLPTPATAHAPGAPSARRTHSGSPTGRSARARTSHSDGGPPTPVRAPGPLAGRATRGPSPTRATRRRRRRRPPAHGRPYLNPP